MIFTNSDGGAKAKQEILYLLLFAGEKL